MSWQGRTLTLLALASAASALSPELHLLPPRPLGDVAAVYALIERVLPGTSSHFALSLAASCAGVAGVAPGVACFTLSDAADEVSIVGTSASELTGGLGVYLREYCNMTIGWPRGGGSSMTIPAVWPRVGAPLVRARSTPFSYMENVCTHSYSLVWYDWAAWEHFIDWQALSGINHVLAVTGQEEVQWKVFTQFNLTDAEIRQWFNGPAFLTWSRGQNEYGNNIAGPLPRSWMQAQWALQKQILARYRSLGVVGQLPAFQGNVPWALAALQRDSNMTQQGDTGWMSSLDPLFGRIADAWMATLCADFGCTDHWYQLDGYFDGGTAPWRVQGVGAPGSAGAVAAAAAQGRRAAALPLALPPCTWSPEQRNTYLAGCEQACASSTTLAAAQSACEADPSCGGITAPPGGGHYELRAASVPAASPSGESSWVITNGAQCRPPAPPITPDPLWRARGAAAYAGVARTDPDAIWSFQGWAIIDWSTAEQGSAFYGFVDAVPRGKFVVIDMSVDGTGEWSKWGTSFFGAPFIWTTLHDFGGTDGMKGDLAHANAIPFVGPSPNATIAGTGFTPEGIDQNPVYYEFVLSAAFRAAPVANLTAWVIDRAHRRYSLPDAAPEVDAAWALLATSTYAQDLSVQDSTGVPHLPGSASQFATDRRTPSAVLCRTYAAWGQLLAAAAYAAGPGAEPFRYDLVNLGREILAQLSTPVSQNFSDALKAKPLDAAALTATGNLYTDLLADVDALVATDSAFLLGPWIAAARAWGAGSGDCVRWGAPVACEDFYEWNARSQLTTWNPTQPGAAKKPGGPDDYASKHWSGLIQDYYRARAVGLLSQGLTDAADGRALNQTAVDAFEATLAYTWQTATNAYPTSPVGDAVAVSTAMRAKWGSYFAAC